LFTVGMFSMLDVMLQMPIGEALEPLRLPPQARRALIDGDGPWRPYLDLVRALEWADAASIARHATTLQIPLPVVWKLNDDAARWAQSALSDPDGDSPVGLATRPMSRGGG
jgi:EAL and modified HD-GYP domain-containing signal transduction protein